MDTLVLNADGQPVNYLPLSAINWREAVTYLWLDKVNVLEWYDDWVVHSSNWETKVPAVIMLKEMARRRLRPRFSKYNVHLRDLFTCQYCLIPSPKDSLTLDHVHPISRGGKTNWENIVTACPYCNSRKGSRIDIKPKSNPHAPSYYELVSKRKQMHFDLKHPSWKTFL